MASSSSANSTTGWKHDAFLNFRGTDTRNNFTSHLHGALCRKGIRPFIDDRLERGKEISAALLEEIEGSRISLLVFSKDYASSTYCLEELVKILECHESKGQIVVPIFYNVNPDEVDEQTGCFGEAFTRHEDEALSMEDKERVRIWRAALSTASSFSGWHLNNRNEADFIQCIVEDVFSKVNRKALHVAEYPVGLDSPLEDMNHMLSIGSNDVRMVGICGTGGIGKTTIAKAIFNKFANQFEGSSFLLNVRENSKRNGVSLLQETLLFETLGDKIVLMGNFDVGINVLRSRLCNKRFLIVIDDVDDVEQLKKLAGALDWFGSGSRIIITTRDKHLLSSHGVTSVLEVKELCPDDALQLFSWNAFKQPQPEENYAELSHYVTKYANGLPLALIVLGSDLFGRSVSAWESELDKLRRIPKRKIFDILKISFDGLEENEKAIFLHIACFFKGEDKNYLTQVLEACDYHPIDGIQNLIDKSLISIESNRLQMHDLIQSMGREVVHQESPSLPGERSRLWFGEDVLQVFREDMGTHKIEGIMLDLPDEEELFLTAEAFTKMKRLRMLIICNAHITGCPEYLPNELRWLEWPGCPLESMPSSFRARKLVAVKMPNSRIRQLGMGLKYCRNLKSMSFRDCELLTEIPDFSTIPNLERLDLEGCTSLVKIHPSIGFLGKLVFLSFAFCSNLESLPSCFKLISLEELLLNGCTKLEELPDMENMRHLCYLYLTGTAIKELPSKIEFLSDLRYLTLTRCKNLTSLPSSIYKLNMLTLLHLQGCSNFSKFTENTENERSSCSCSASSNDFWDSSICSLHPFPSSESPNLSRYPHTDFSMGLSNLSSLQVVDCNLPDLEFLSHLGCFSMLDGLYLSGNNFASIPSCLSRFTRLRALDVSKCPQLQEIPELPKRIRSVEARDCRSLERCSQLTQIFQFNAEERLDLVSLLDFSNCHKLAAAQGKSLENHQYLVDKSALQKFEVILPGSEILEWFDYKSDGSSLSFEVPSNICRRIRALLLCLVMRLEDAGASNVSHKVSIDGINVISHSRQFFALESDHMWFCYHPMLYFHPSWKNDSGISEVSFEIQCATTSGTLEKCGVYLVCEQETLKRDMSSNATLSKESNAGLESNHDSESNDDPDPDENELEVSLGLSLGPAVLMGQDTLDIGELEDTDDDGSKTDGDSERKRKILTYGNELQLSLALPLQPTGGLMAHDPSGIGELKEISNEDWESNIDQERNEETEFETSLTLPLLSTFPMIDQNPSGIEDRPRKRMRTTDELQLSLGLPSETTVVMTQNPVGTEGLEHVHDNGTESNMRKFRKTDKEHVMAFNNDEDHEFDSSLALSLRPTVLITQKAVDMEEKEEKEDTVQEQESDIISDFGRP